MPSPPWAPCSCPEPKRPYNVKRQIQYAKEKTRISICYNQDRSHSPSEYIPSTQSIPFACGTHLCVSLRIASAAPPPFHFPHIHTHQVLGMVCSMRSSFAFSSRTCRWPSSKDAQTRHWPPSENLKDEALDGLAAHGAGRVVLLLQIRGAGSAAAFVHAARIRQTDRLSACKCGLPAAATYIRHHPSRQS
jgi:hypothetical protein